MRMIILAKDNFWQKIKEREEFYLLLDKRSERMPPKFEIGDIAIPKKLISFSNGTSHKAGERLVVTAEERSYFNVMKQYYDREEKECCDAPIIVNGKELV